MCLGGDGLKEIDTIWRLITKVYPSGTISIVCDTWDFWKVITEYLPALKDAIMERDGKVVIRPDSGDPADIICGTAQIIDYIHYGKEVSTIDNLKAFANDWISETIRDDTPHGEQGAISATVFFRFKGDIYEIEVDMEWNRHDKQFYFMEESSVTKCEIANLTPEQKGAVECLYDTFGGTVTEKGYKQLDTHIGLIYGDSITLDRCRDICSRLASKGYASTNVVFGIGSYTYQYNTRDTFGFAMKATYAEVDGEAREIFKKPKTDDGTKNSARGLTAVHKAKDGKFYLHEQSNWHLVKNCSLELVYKDGVLVRNTDIHEIRHILKGQR
jgi:nicotinamide phosphoribosyltransferase